ncbi:MAG: hypothetical protein NUW21_04990, partial [Elusimicrobia bacterium]|nr:hypothetical protein [Elusimicrobiota bacterium]
MGFLKRCTAALTSASVLLAVPGPACYEAAAQTVGAASRAGEAAVVPGLGIMPALGTAAGAPSLAPLSAPTLGLPAA